MPEFIVKQPLEHDRKMYNPDGDKTRVIMDSNLAAPLLKSGVLAKPTAPAAKKKAAASKESK